MVYGPISGTHDVDEVGFMAYGSGDMSAAGRSIGIGDVNEDGYADIEFGVPYSADAWVEFGPVTADFDLADASLHYDGSGAPLFGHGSDIADVDADGVEDVIVGAFSYSGGAPDGGAVFIDFGPVSADDIRIVAEHDVELYGSEDYLEAGRVIAAGKDMDGDGIGDMMIQAMGYSGGAPGGGGVAVARGPFPDDLDLADADAFLIGDSPNAYAGSGMAQGDVDGDGTADALVGAPFAGGGTTTTPAGDAYVVAGPTTGVVDLIDADVVIHGTNAGYLGMSLAAGDIDGDTRPELFVGASYEGDGTGAVHLFYGAMPGTWDDVDAAAKFVDPASGQAGVALAVADLDANGRPDLLIGAPVESSKSVQWGGALYVVMSY